MFRPTARRILTQSAPRNAVRTTQSRRFLSTAPPHEKSRSWKNSAARWTLAGALVYYYNTSSAFAEEPSVAHAPPQKPFEPEADPSLESVIARRGAQAKEQLDKKIEASAPEVVVDAQVPAVDAAAPGSPDELEEEASQQGAFNEETGEINWDCPCLGGMAHGPCGEEFREAFSCFVYSKEEPKGVDCIDKFKNMQSCFREHPDIYGAELDDDEAPEGEEFPSESSTSREVETSAAPTAEPTAEPTSHGEKVGSAAASPAEAQAKTERAQAATAQVKGDHVTTSETEEMVPKAWHDSK